MTGLALTMHGILQIRAPGLGGDPMASLAFLHRQSLAPDIAFALVGVMALLTGYPPRFMALMTEPDRRPLPGLPQVNGKKTRLGRLGGA
jgi:hypothetical protein